MATLLNLLTSPSNGIMNSLADHRRGILGFQSDIKRELSDGDSNFGQKVNSYKQIIQDIDNTLKSDRCNLKETLKALNKMHEAANIYIDADKLFADSLEKMGKNALTAGSQHPCIGNALIKLALLFKDLTSLMKIKFKTILEQLIGPLKTFIEQGGQKDLRDNFEKTWKNYDAVMNKSSKKGGGGGDHGAEGGATEGISSGFEDISESKRKAKLDVCDFMIKFNEITSKTGVDFVTQLIELYSAELSYFNKGVSCLSSLEGYMQELDKEMTGYKTAQDQEKTELQEIRDKLRPRTESVGQSDKSDLSKDTQKVEFSLTQAADQSYGINHSGVLNKRTEQLHRWQKRFCTIQDFRFTIAHNPTTSPTANHYLLTCQVRETPSSAVDGKKNCFHLISQDRTYHFQAESELDRKRWTTVIRNNIDQSIRAETGPNDQDSGISSDERKLREFIKKIITRIKSTPGNEKCVDCGRADPTWFATNLGVLVCIHCSGSHRKLGSHNSRIRSLDLDNPITAELLLLYTIGNKMYNEVYEADAPPGCMTSEVPLEERQRHIAAKHSEKKFVRKICANQEELTQTLHRCIESKDMRGLLQVYGEGVKLGAPIPGSLYSETALHIAVSKEDESSLHIVDFLVQNCQGDEINNTDTEGHTALHFAVLNNKPQSIKVLLRGNANPRMQDNTGSTPLDLVKGDQEECRQLLDLAMTGKHLKRCDIVNFDWGIDGQPDFSTCEMDYTDDELDSETPEKPKTKRTDSSRGAAAPPQYSSAQYTAAPITAATTQLATAAAAIAKTKMGFDHQAGGLVYNSSPRGSPAPSSYHNQPVTRTNSNNSPRTTLPTQAQSPFRNSGPVPGGQLAMNIPPTAGPVACTSSPVPSRNTRKSISGTNPPSSTGNRKPSTKVGPKVPKSHRGDRFKTVEKGHSAAAAPRVGQVPLVNRGGGSGGVQRNRSFTMEQAPLVSANNRREIDDLSRLMRSSSALQKRISAPAAVSVSSSLQQNPPVPHREPPALPPRPQRRRVKAVYDCPADDDDELSFSRGDIIFVVEEIDDQWWFGVIEGDANRKGIFPKNFVKALPT